MRATDSLSFSFNVVPDLAIGEQYGFVDLSPGGLACNFSFRQFANSGIIPLGIKMVARTGGAAADRRQLTAQTSLIGQFFDVMGNPTNPNSKSVIVTNASPAIDTTGTNNTIVIVDSYVVPVFITVPVISFSLISCYFGLLAPITVACPLTFALQIFYRMP